MAISRRTLLNATGAVASQWALSSSSAQEQPLSEGYTDSAAAEKWLDIMLTKAQATNTPLFLGRFADRTYFLSKPISWSPDAGQVGYKEVKVPTGFVTDFASIPRVFWSVLPPDGTYTYAAIIHDYLYWEQPVSKNDADTILKFVMAEFKVDPISAGAIYKGVNLGGGAAWRKNAALKASGEKRVLKKFPDDPKITWPIWKTTAGSV